MMDNLKSQVGKNVDKKVKETINKSKKIAESKKKAANQKSKSNKKTIESF